MAVRRNNDHGQRAVEELAVGIGSSEGYEWNGVGAAFAIALDRFGIGQPKPWRDRNRAGRNNCVHLGVGHAAEHQGPVAALCRCRVRSQQGCVDIEHTVSRAVVGHAYDHVHQIIVRLVEVDATDGDIRARTGPIERHLWVNERRLVAHDVNHRMVNTVVARA